MQTIFSFHVVKRVFYKHLENFEHWCNGYNPDKIDHTRVWILSNIIHFSYKCIYLGLFSFEKMFSSYVQGSWDKVNYLLKCLDWKKFNKKSFFTLQLSSSLLLRVLFTFFVFCCRYVSHLNTYIHLYGVPCTVYLWCKP